MEAAHGPWMEAVYYYDMNHMMMHACVSLSKQYMDHGWRLTEPEEHGLGPRMEAVHHSAHGPWMEAVHHSACSTWTMDGGSVSLSMQHTDHGWRQCIIQCTDYEMDGDSRHHSIHGP